MSYDLPEEIPGADKALDLVKMGTDKVFDVAWRFMAYRHRRDEVTFIFLEHARAFTEETLLLLHSNSDVPQAGPRRSRLAGDMMAPPQGVRAVPDHRTAATDRDLVMDRP